MRHSDSPPSRPRVALLTSPSLMGALIIDAFDCEPGLELAGIGLTNRVFKNTGLVGTIRRVVRRSGWPYFVYGAAESTIAWGRLRGKKLPRALERSDLPVRPVTDVNDSHTLEWLKPLQPDYVVSFFFNQWIGAGVRSVAARGCVNVHPSLLPSLRGPDPVFRALERGLTETGITLHDVADDFDAGRIRASVTRPFDPARSHFHNLRELVEFGAAWSARQLAEGLPRDETREVPRESTRESTPGATDDYATFPTAAEVKAFRKRGGKLFEWREVRGAIAALASQPAVGPS